MITEQLARSGPVQRFVARARAYCALIEDCESLPPLNFTVESAALLCALYEAGLRLPDVSPARGSASETPVVSERPDEVRRTINKKFGQHEAHWEVFDPFEADEPVASTLGDDFVDIYEDLKSGLAVFDGGSEDGIVDALWQWKFDFGNHWGRHAVSTLRALHHLIADHRLL